MSSRTSLRAITTRYKGYNFRSRLEARWAVFFDHLKIRWDYEPEGFELGNGLRYLPDFWLPDLKLWVEVKPGLPDLITKEKACRLAAQSGYWVYVTNGMPDQFGTLFTTSHEGGKKYHFKATVSWAVEEPMVVVVDRISDDVEELGLRFCDQWRKAMRFHAKPDPKGRVFTPIGPAGTPALEAARGARFEFGEKGGVV